MSLSLYRTFIFCFFASIIAFIIFITQYLHFFSQIITHSISLNGEDPQQVFRLLFSPALIVSAIIMAIAGLAYKIIGILFVAQKKELPGGEQALWIIGFIFLGFVTSIVFMALAKSKEWVTLSYDKYPS